MDSFEANQPQRDSVRFPRSTTAGYRPTADGAFSIQTLRVTGSYKRDGLLRVAASTNHGGVHKQSHVWS
jgi:hypothetical protein